MQQNMKHSSNRSRVCLSIKPYLMLNFSRLLLVGPHAPTGEMRYLTEGEQRWYEFVYGTGVGAAVLTVNSEQLKDGGAKEFADAVFHGGKTNLAGLV
jgi:hypothetical protein